MSLNHLTDRQIQRYLDHTRTEDNAAIMAHVAHCAKCQKAIQAYRAVYLELQSEPERSFSPAFEEAIIARVSPRADQKLHIRKYLVSTVPIIIGLVLPAGFFLRRYFQSTSFQFLNQTWVSFRSLYDYGLDVLERLHINLEYLIPAAMILLFFSVFEKFILVSKHKKPIIFNTF